MTFAQALRSYGGGPEAMRRAWQDVRAGRVTAPPRPGRARGPRQLSRRSVALMRREANPVTGEEYNLALELGYKAGTASRRGDEATARWHQEAFRKRLRLYPTSERHELERAFADGYRDAYGPSKKFEPFNPTPRYRVQRIESPARFDPRSFRTVTPRRGVRVTVGCPKGQYDARRKRCRVGTRVQRVMRKKNPYYAVLDAAEGTLLGGQRRVTSWPYRDRADAERYLVQAGRANLDAGRKLGRTRVIYRRSDPLHRVSIPKGDPRKWSLPVVNPWRGTELYDRVLELRGQKGRNGRYPNQRFVHRFSSRARAVGLPNGDVLLTTRR